MCFKFPYSFDIKTFTDIINKTQELVSYSHGVGLKVLWLIPNILTTSNCFHVTTLVLLRLIATERPMSYRAIHLEFRNTAVPIIWVGSIIFCSIPIINEFLPLSRDVHKIWRIVILHVGHTLPICLTAILYLRTIWVLSKPNNEDMCDLQEVPEVTKRLSLALQEKKRQMSKMITGIVICLLICYVPYLIQWQLDILVDRNTSELSTGEVTTRIIRNIAL